MGLVATTEIAVAAWLLCRGQGDRVLRFDLPGTIRFALVCLLLVPLGGAVIVTSFLWLIDLLPPELLFVFARNWWLSVGFAWCH